MKHLLLLGLLAISNYSFATDGIETITCALETKRVGYNVRRARAQELIQLSLVGQNVFRMKRYRGHFFDGGYRATSNGKGRVVELIEVENRGFKVTSRTLLATDFSSLIDDATTGGYPGAGSPPRRINRYSCMINYPKDLVEVTREEVVVDFNF